jgi:hypothetical protein
MSNGCQVSLRAENHLLYNADRGTLSDSLYVSRFFCLLPLPHNAANSTSCQSGDVIGFHIVKAVISWLAWLYESLFKKFY